MTVLTNRAVTLANLALPPQNRLEALTKKGQSDRRGQAEDAAVRRPP